MTGLADVVRLPAWHRYAASAGATGLFFAADPVSEVIALALCRTCGVREECLREALQEEEDGWHVYGVRGGYTAAERSTLQRV